MSLHTRMIAQPAYLDYPRHCVTVIAAFQCTYARGVGSYTIARTQPSKDRSYIFAVGVAMTETDAQTPKWKEKSFLCDECGPFVSVDEDGCCVTCGADALIVRRDYALWVEWMGSEKEGPFMVLHD